MRSWVDYLVGHVGRLRVEWGDNELRRGLMAVSMLGGVRTRLAELIGNRPLDMHLLTSIALSRQACHGKTEPDVDVLEAQSGGLPPIRGD